MKDKILNLLLVTLVFLLVIQYFWNTQKQTWTSTESVVVETTASSYSIPAHVWLKVKNNTHSWITLSPCKDITLNLNGETVALKGITCDTLSIEVGKEQIIDFSPAYEQLLTPGKYVFEAQVSEKKFIVPFELGNRNTLWKIFVFLFYAPIYNLMVFLLYVLGNSLGWAIIAVTIIIRIILLWPQHKMMISQKKLQWIQPKIKELQEKYKGDSQKLWLELMALYKKENVNPMGSCGLLIIQLPILLVIYNVITSILDASNSYYLYSFFSQFQVSQIHTNFYGIDLLGIWGLHGAILALFVWVVQFFQVKLSLAQNQKDSKKGLVLEKKPWEESYNPLMPDPEFMNKFMLYGMPAMVVVFTYSLFIWIGIYWGVSTIFAIFQQLLVNKILKK